MEQSEEKEKKRINWHIGIPVALWIGIVVLGIIKVSLGSVGIKSTCFKIEELLTAYINTFNCNTFSTFISVTACMLYQHFSTEKKEERERVSGLSMKRMPLIIIMSLIYIILAAFDAAISHIAMSIIFSIMNVIYVVCFFALFLVKTKAKLRKE